ncbi:hypothetical protein EYC84_010943 [Monilinia fructicola]|uniref:Uncharacterized protein n=1 Tax=Monilinia fructicola TaxID=38448 RepID=A0A5M9J6P5_MONFR|nr:hypothetical protein EYC84_010943 [Monilinia fructicola]
MIDSVDHFLLTSLVYQANTTYHSSNFLFIPFLFNSCHPFHCQTILQYLMASRKLEPIKESDPFLVQSYKSS